MTDILKIDRVKLHKCNVHCNLKYATDTLSLPTSLIVELRSQGLTGWGEVLLPDPGFLWSWAIRIAPLVTGQDAMQLDCLFDKWPGDRPRMKPSECSTYCHPDVDCVAEAFSIALHDIVSRAKGIPFRELLGTTKRTAIPGMPVVIIDSPSQMAADALAWVSSGFDHIKIKIAGHAAEDSARLREIRDVVGTSVDLQIDANGSYPDYDSALPLIATLNECNIAVIEDLFDIGNPELCRRARQECTGRYMVDKDAHWPHVREILSLEAADIINQHPHNQGRMTYAVNIARAAQEAGIENAIGSSGIFGIQNAAFQQLAGFMGLTRPCEDIGMHMYFDGPCPERYGFSVRPTVLKEPLMVEDGCIQLSDEPGLDVEVDERLLKSFTVTSETF